MDENRARFEAVVEPLVWGRNVYTIVKVTDALARAAVTASTRRVDGTLDGVAVNVGLNRADVIPDTFIYLGKPMLRRLQVAAGDVLDCDLAPADPDLVPVPVDVAQALDDGGRMAAFERIAAPQRRQLIVPVEAAVRPDTRARRIRDLLAGLPDF